MAKIEINVLVKGVAKRKTVTVRQNDDLYELSTYSFPGSQ